MSNLQAFKVGLGLKTPIALYFFFQDSLFKVFSRVEKLLLTTKLTLMYQEEVNDDQDNNDQLCQGTMDLSIEKDTSIYIPEDTTASSSEASDDQQSKGDQLRVQRTKKNEFFKSCCVGAIGPCKKR